MIADISCDTMHREKNKVAGIIIMPVETKWSVKLESHCARAFGGKLKSANLYVTIPIG